MSALSGMDAISTYATRSANNIRLLVKNDNFPAVKIGGSWESDTGLIDKWRIWYVLQKHNATSIKLDLYDELISVLKDRK